MNILVRKVWVIIGALVFSAVSAASAERTTPQNLDALERAINDTLAASTIQGASVVVIEHGEVVKVSHYGVAERNTDRPVNDQTVFRAGSISKSLTSIAAMMLVEDGAIALDTRAVGLIPSLDLDNRWARTDPVRLVHLLEHTAGFSDIAFHHYLLEGGGMPLAEAVERFGPFRSRWRPGTLTSYSNQGPIVAARMLEIAAGEPFEDFMHRRVTAPLGIKSATWKGSSKLESRLARSYRPDGITEERFIDTPGWPSGGLNVTARDLARLPLLMLGRGTLDGVTLLSPESVERIETPESSDAARAGLRHGYGLGNLVMPRGRALFFGHDGSIDGFAATFAYAPALDAGFIVMANTTSEAIFDLAGRIRDYLERDLSPLSVESIAGAGQRPQAWEGQFQTLTPRRQLLAGLIGLTQWQGASIEQGDLRFRGAMWKNIGEGLWQRGDAIVPELVLIERDGERRLQMGLSTYRQVSALEMWTKVVFLGAFVLLLAISVPHAILVAWSGLRGRLAARGGLAMRLWPLVAVYAVAGVAIYTLALFQTSDLEFLGRQTPAAWGLFVWSALAPLIVALAIFSVWRRSAGAGPIALFLAISYTTVASVACIYLAAHGWIGLRMWQA